jgi:N-formylglutamate amidohydrolase
MIKKYVRRFGKIFIYDVHSYNYKVRSSGNSDENPDINIGTGNIDNEYWKELTTGFICNLKAFDFAGSHLDVRENIKFKGGFFSKWINENFGNDVCVLSVEIKKIYMNELKGEFFPDKALMIKNALHSTMNGVLKNLEKAKFKTG